MNDQQSTTLGQRLFTAFALVVLVINGAYPMVWIALTSFKKELELQNLPITYWPQDATLENYAAVFTQQPFARFFWNSIVVASTSTAVCVFVAALAAYAIARLNLRYKNTLQMLIVAASVFPVVSLIVPLFQTMRALGWLNTHWALVVPYAAFSLPISTLVLVTFFQSIPQDLEAAAQVDGCSKLGALWRIIVPLAAPGVVTAGILAFVNSWNEFLLAYTFNSSLSMRTVPVGVTLFQGEFTFPWPVISAAIVVTIVPVVTLILVFQQRIISGLTAGAVKG